MWNEAEKQRFSEKMHLLTLLKQGITREILSCLQGMTVPITQPLLDDCLLQALYCEPVVLEQLLERCEADICILREVFFIRWKPDPDTPEPYRSKVLVTGTPTVLAAVMNRPQHLAILLDKNWPEQWPENQIFSPEEPEASYLRSGLSPLAAALQMNSTACVELLLERGADVTHPSVSAALLLPWRKGDRVYQANCAALRGEDPLPHPEAAAQVADPQRLRQELHTHAYPAAELEKAALAVLEKTERIWYNETKAAEDAKRLSVLLEQAPLGQSCPKVGQRLVQAAMEWEVFLPLLSCCGDTLDLSDCVWELENWSYGVLKEWLEARTADFTLVCGDMELNGLSARRWSLLLRTICFDFDGGNGVRRAILQTGDPRLIRRADRLGIFPPEKLPSLLEAAQGLPAVSRAFLLRRCGEDVKGD